MHSLTGDRIERRASGCAVRAETGLVEHDAGITLAAHAARGDRDHAITHRYRPARKVGRHPVAECVQDADVFVAEEHRERMVRPVPAKNVVIRATHAGELLPDDDATWIRGRKIELFDRK